MISVRNLHKQFDNKEVLKNITLKFQRGKVYGIVGENGAGKSTLFRCIAGLEKYKGAIESDKTPLKHHLGWMETSPYFLPKITAEEHIRLLAKARDKKIDNMKEWNFFALPLEQYAATFSTGMKKKLALTAILTQENEYFILDEPYNGIDLQSSIILTEVIHRLKAKNKIVLISSHIFSTLKDTCDEIVVLENKEIKKVYSISEFDTLEEEMKSKIADLTIPI